MKNILSKMNNHEPMTLEYANILLRALHKKEINQSVVNQVKSVILGYGQGFKPQLSKFSVY